MPTPKLNDFVLKVAHRLKDNRTDATATGDTKMVFSSALLVQYVNSAIRDYLSEQYAESIKSGSSFGNAFPEYVKPVVDLPVDAEDKTPRPNDAIFVFELSSPDREYTRIPIEGLKHVLSGQNPEYQPTTDDPAFYEEGGYIKLLPVGIHTDVPLVNIRYIFIHNDIVLNDSEDIPLIGHQDEIVKRAVAYGVADSTVQSSS